MPNPIFTEEQATEISKNRKYYEVETYNGHFEKMPYTKLFDQDKHDDKDKIMRPGDSLEESKAYLSEQDTDIDYISGDKERQNAILSALVNKLFDDCNVAIDTNQIKFHYLKPASVKLAKSKNDDEPKEKTPYEAFMEDVNTKIGNNLQTKGEEKQPWEVVTADEIEALPSQPTYENYNKMYFSVLKEASKRLQDKVKDLPLEEQKNTFENFLNDYSETMMAVHAVMGGYKFSDEFRDYQGLQHPIFGCVTPENFEKEVIATIPVDFLRDRSEEIEVDLNTLNTKETFKPGELMYIGNEFRKAEQNLKEHSDIARWFADTWICKKLGFLQHIRDKEEKFANLAAFAKKFSTLDPKKNKEPQLVKNGIDEICKCADIKRQNTLNQITNAFRQKEMNIYQNHIEGNFYINGIDLTAGSERFRAVSTAHLKHQCPRIFRRVCAGRAIEKIHDVTGYPSLDNDPKSWAKINEEAYNNPKSYAKLRGHDDNYDYWMKQVESYTGEGIKGKNPLSDEQMKEKLNEEVTNLNNRMASKNIKIQLDLDLDNPNEQITLENAGKNSMSKDTLNQVIGQDDMTYDEVNKYQMGNIREAKDLMNTIDVVPVQNTNDNPETTVNNDEPEF
ncbi:MAG: hypothetical protein KBS59_03610 [Clostridiales bacterium]|nr:hypothetical protein [Clostridiales bacterium]